MVSTRGPRTAPPLVEAEAAAPPKASYLTVTGPARDQIAGMRQRLGIFCFGLGAVYAVQLCNVTKQLNRSFRRLCPTFAHASSATACHLSLDRRSESLHMLAHRGNPGLCSTQTAATNFTSH